MTFLNKSQKLTDGLGCCWLMDGDGEVWFTGGCDDLDDCDGEGDGCCRWLGDCEDGDNDLPPPAPCGAGGGVGPVGCWDDGCDDCCWDGSWGWGI